MHIVDRKKETRYASLILEEVKGLARRVSDKV